MNIAKTGKQISAENRNKIYFDVGDVLVHDSEGNRYDREKLEPLDEKGTNDGRSEGVTVDIDAQKKIPTWSEALESFDFASHAEAPGQTPTQVESGAKVHKKLVLDKFLTEKTRLVVRKLGALPQPTLSEAHFFAVTYLQAALANYCAIHSLAWS